MGILDYFNAFLNCCFIIMFAFFKMWKWKENGCNHNSHTGINNNMSGAIVFPLPKSETTLPLHNKTAQC